MIQFTFQREPSPDHVIRGDVRIPEGSPPRSAVVLVHGFKGFKDWGFFPWLAHRLAAAGHAVVSFNFSGSGIGSDPGQFTDLEGFARNTFSRELEELSFVVELIRSGELLPWAPRRTGLLGHSRGGGSAILHASRDVRVDALVTWAAVSSFARGTKETIEEWRASGRMYVLNGRTGQQMPLDVTLLDDYETNRERLDLRVAAEGIAAPWLIVHGEEDLTVPPEGARLLLVPGAGHTYGVSHPFDESSPQLETALEATLVHFEKHLTC